MNMEHNYNENNGKLQASLDNLEYELLVQELSRSRGNASQAARRLGISIRKIGLRIKKHKIEVGQFK